MYQAIQFHSRYTFEKDEVYGNNKTFILETSDLALLAVLNSPLMWWLGWRHFIHLKDEALSNDQVKIIELPIALPSFTKEEICPSTAEILKLTSDIASAEHTISDWLCHEFGIAKFSQDVRNTSALSADDFVVVVRNLLPKKSKLTAAQIADLKREHAATVEPARKIRAQIFALERKVSDLVNDAYGLTSQEVDLMWRTAPPRMPFTPTGTTEDDKRIASVTDEE
jgi:hypothetical protein